MAFPLLAIPLLKGFLSGIIGFIKDNFKEILIALACIAIFYAGTLYEERKKNAEIKDIHAFYKEKDRLREEQVQDTIKEIEDSARKAAGILEEQKKQAEADADRLRRAYVEQVLNRQKRIDELQIKLDKMKKEGASKEEIEKTEHEIGGLKLTYSLSPEAIITINGFVEVYK